MHLFLSPPATVNTQTGHVPSTSRPKEPCGAKQGLCTTRGDIALPILWFRSNSVDRWVAVDVRVRRLSQPLSLLSAVLTIVRGEKKTLLRPFCFEHQRCARAPLKSLRHSEITLWGTSCTRARVRKIEWDKEKRELQQKWQECSANWKARGERERRRKTERREERWAKRQFKSRKEQRE